MSDQLKAVLQSYRRAHDGMSDDVRDMVEGRTPIPCCTDCARAAKAILDRASMIRGLLAKTVLDEVDDIFPGPVFLHPDMDIGDESGMRIAFDAYLPGKGRLSPGRGIWQITHSAHNPNLSFAVSVGPRDLMMDLIETRTDIPVPDYSQGFPPDFDFEAFQSITQFQVLQAIKAGRTNAYLERPTQPFPINAIPRPLWSYLHFGNRYLTHHDLGTFKDENGEPIERSSVEDIPKLVKQLADWMRNLIEEAQ